MIELWGGLFAVGDAVCIELSDSRFSDFWFRCALLDLFVAISRACNGYVTIITWILGFVKCFVKYFSNPDFRSDLLKPQ
ncbi:hypothetical protein [Limnospira indica]|uniref:hypothetical protein n=1 Tax=Limnospira indica TaxID=147322 RepID=UPI0002FF77B3|nr:hypothetical protein [Limnospira indica]